MRRPIEKLALRAKGLREAISVHCLEAEKREVIATGSSSGSVLFYRLRIEDVETTQWWMVLKRYRDFAALHAQLVALWPPTIELAFPAKVMVVEIASQLNKFCDFCFVFNVVKAPFLFICQFDCVVHGLHLLFPSSFGSMRLRSFCLSHRC